MSSITKEYLVSVPGLTRLCTVRQLQPEYTIIKERPTPECPDCGNNQTYRVTWSGRPIKCAVCDYPRKTDETKL